MNWFKPFTAGSHQRTGINIKVGTHDGTSPCNKSQGLQSHRVNWQLVPATSRRDQSLCVNCFKIQSQGPKFWSRRLDFAAKMASSHDATSPCDLLHGTVAGTSPIVCADLKHIMQHMQTEQSAFKQLLFMEIITEGTNCQQLTGSAFVGLCLCLSAFGIVPYACTLLEDNLS